MNNSNPSVAKSALVIPTALDERIERIIHEYRHQNKLKSHNLIHRRKVLLVGPPGTGKTMTAKVLAHELRLPLVTIRVDWLVTRFMGETSVMLRQILNPILNETGVYFFDEFDAIWGERFLENDVWEMRRVLNSFFQLMEQDSFDSMVIAATNSPKLLNRALFRRFDDVIYYEQPSDDERKRLIKNVLGLYLTDSFSWKQVLESSADLSHAEIDQACRDAIKNAILSDRTKVNATELIKVFPDLRNYFISRRGR
jgi:SpoVK/Ycf46/Vps4 family AAA+-type ATPase